MHPIAEQPRPVPFPVLMFHDLGPKTSATSIQPDVFSRGLDRLAQNGHFTLSLSLVAEMLRRGEALPERGFCITFDDGFRSVYSEALEVLLRHGMTATVFLTVGTERRTSDNQRLPPICGGSMLSWDEIRQMYLQGISFGAHTLTHPDLTRLSSSEQEQEICDSKAVIEDALGCEVDSFAFPFGRYDRCSLQIARQHFTCACSDRLGLVRPDSDLHALERVDGYYLHTDLRFGLMGHRVFPWYVQAVAVPRRLRRLLLSLGQRQ